jgi:hypothetical protein
LDITKSLLAGRVVPRLGGIIINMNLQTMGSGARKVHETGDGGHLGLGNDGFTTLNANLSRKIKLKVLKGKMAPEPREKKMILDFKKSKMTPEKFLETWKG